VIEEVPLAQSWRRIEFAGGPVTAIAIPWGDLATAWFSTGIPNIDTYAVVPRAAASRALARARLRNGAACCLRHSEQWQFNGLDSGPVISNFTPPQRQLPRTVVMASSFSACDRQRTFAQTGGTTESLPNEGALR
jgi:hypothetical protein